MNPMSAVVESLFSFRDWKAFGAFQLLFLMIAISMMAKNTFYDEQHGQYQQGTRGSLQLHQQRSQYRSWRSEDKGIEGARSLHPLGIHSRRLRSHSTFSSDTTVLCTSRACHRWKGEFHDRIQFEGRYNVPQQISFSSYKEINIF